MNAGKIVTFLNEVKVELKKVSWPSRDELIGSTIIVCLLAGVFAVILGVMDFTFGHAMRLLIG